MWLMLQQAAPCDLVFGTGETHSVREFVEEAFGYVSLDWRQYVAEDLRYLRRSCRPIPPRPSDGSDGSPGSRSWTSSGS